MPKSETKGQLPKLFADDEEQLNKLIGIITHCKPLYADATFLWALITKPKNDLEGDIAHYAYWAGDKFQWLNKGWLYRDASAAHTLREYAVTCLAIGMMQGMALGRKLDSKTGGNVALLLKHAPVHRLLLQKKPKATNLEICKALDVVERLPWSKLKKELGSWQRAAGHQSVRTLITQARKAAQAAANYEHLLSGLKGVDDVTGLVTNR